jgi:hypothetical protein
LTEAAGFGDVRNAKAQPIRLPDEILSQHFSAEEIAAFRASGVELKSVTVLATKPNNFRRERRWSTSAPMPIFSRALPVPAGQDHRMMLFGRRRSEPLLLYARC